MNCQDIRERLPALIDKELSPAELAEMEKHLAECPDCQKEKTRQEKFTTSVKISLEGLKPSDRFIKQVIEKLPEGAPQAREAEVAAAAARRKTMISLAVALIVIALAVALTAIIAARRKAQENPQPRPGAVQPEAPK
jgi:anti-sigma factor RsiW